MTAVADLSAPVRLGAFGAGLLVVLAASFGVGRVTGDVEQEPSADRPAVSEPAEQPTGQPSEDHQEMGS